MADYMLVMPGTDEWFRITYYDYVEERLRIFRSRLIGQCNDISSKYRKAVELQKHLKGMPEIPELIEIADQRVLTNIRNFEINKLRLDTIDNILRNKNVDFRKYSTLLILLNEYFERYKTGK